ncbi:hypothetical protein KIPB_000126 [Kipferlia bialata]|uniref:Uncharacterized protein n=1 Tax=Kipferlia bialata TaxID=797122 RepID=A0A9K3CNI8_9EUKA|nr:hypothetical protein KIPB_000126 [Kipferlia bialata]|eukprot:g126.t1
MVDDSCIRAEVSRTVGERTMRLKRSTPRRIRHTLRGRGTTQSPPFIIQETLPHGMQTEIVKIIVMGTVGQHTHTPV